MPARKSITKSEVKANRGRGSRVGVAASVTLSSVLGVFAQSDAAASDGVEPIDLQSPPKREWACSHSAELRQRYRIRGRRW